MQNKKAGGGLGWLIGIGSLVALVLIVGIVWYGVSKQSAYQDQQLALQKAAQQAQDKTKTAPAAPAANRGGTASVVKAAAYDFESTNTGTATAIPAYAYQYVVDSQTGKTSETPSYIGSASATTLSTSGTSFNTVIGNKLCGVAFNATGGTTGTTGYYGVEKCINVVRDYDDLALETHKICRQDQMQGYLEDYSNNKGLNLTLGANTASNSFRDLFFRVNSSNCAYNLGAIAIKVGSGTKDYINSVTLDGGDNAMTKSSLSLSRINSQFLYELDTPLMMHQYQSITTGSLTLTGSGVGCSTTEFVNVTAMDKSKFQSAKGSNPILEGYENDAQTPADVGGADVLIASSGKGTSTANAVNGDGTYSFACTS